MRRAQHRRRRRVLRRKRCAPLGRISAFYHEASGGKYAPRAVDVDLEPGVIEASIRSRLLASSSARATS
jgi:hypothetical protein